MRLTLKVFCVVAISTVFSISTAWAKNTEFGLGPRAVAMGQAQVAAGNDGSATQYNPATLIQARDYWGLGHLEPYLTLVSAGADPTLIINDEHQQEGYGPQFYMQGLIPIGKRIVVGASIFLSTDKLLTVDLFFPPGMGRWGVDNTFGLGTVLAFQVTKKLSFAYAGQSQLAYNSSELQLDLYPILGSILGMDLGAVYDVNPAFELDIISHNSYKLGALYRPFDWLSLGLVYSYRNPSPVYIPIRVITGDLMGNFSIVVEQWGISPTYVTGGIALYPIEGLTIAFDLTRALYSEEKKAGMRFNSDNPDFATDYSHVELEDIWWAKWGVEWKDNFKGKYEKVDYGIRAGYAYYETPYPPQGSSKNLSGTYDSDAHYYTGGLLLGYHPYSGGMRKGPKYIALEYFYEYIHLVERTHRSITRNPATIVTKGHIVYSGVGLSMHF